MSEKFTKIEKLKHTKLIETLFLEGKAISFYPIKLIYLPYLFTDQAKIKVGFAVSKRNFKLAVNRNLLKRRMREVYRRNKPNQLTNSYACMFLYTSKKKENYEVMEKKMKQCLLKLVDQEKLP